MMIHPASRFSTDNRSGFAVFWADRRPPFRSSIFRVMSGLPVARPQSAGQLQKTIQPLRATRALLNALDIVD
jgi:hypothetical protein